MDENVLFIIKKINKNMVDDLAMQILHGISWVQYKMGVHRIDSYDLSS